MKFILLLLLVTAALLVLLLSPAIVYASDWTNFRDGIKDIVVEKVLSWGGAMGGMAGIGALLLGKLLNDNSKIQRGMKETGEFFRVVGSAIEDGKITGKEIGRILKEGRDVIDLCRKTPSKYQ